MLDWYVCDSLKSKCLFLAVRRVFSLHFVYTFQVVCKQPNIGIYYSSIAAFLLVFPLPYFVGVQLLVYPTTVPLYSIVNYKAYTMLYLNYNLLCSCSFLFLDYRRNTCRYRRRGDYSGCCSCGFICSSFVKRLYYNPFFLYCSFICSFYDWGSCSCRSCSRSCSFGCSSCSFGCSLGL